SRRTGQGREFGPLGPLNFPGPARARVLSPHRLYAFLLVALSNIVDCPYGAREDGGNLCRGHLSIKQLQNTTTRLDPVLVLARMKERFHRPTFSASEGDA